MDKNKVFENLKEIFGYTRVAVSQDCFKKMPAEPGVYWYVRGDGEILYIGDSINLSKRIKDETRVPFVFNSSDGVPSNLPSTNIRLRKLIEENSKNSKFRLHYIQTTQVCEILYECKCNCVKCEKNCLNWEEDCVHFILKDKGLIYETSLSKLARIAPKQTLAVIQAWNGTSSEKATMSLERVLLMSYWLEFHRLPHWNLTF